MDCHHLSTEIQFCPALRLHPLHRWTISASDLLPLTHHLSMKTPLCLSLAVCVRFSLSLSFPTVQCSYSLSLPLSPPLSPSLSPSPSPSLCPSLTLSLPFPTDQCSYPPSPFSNRSVFIPSLSRFQQSSVHTLPLPFPTEQCSYSLSLSLSPPPSLFPLSNRSVFVV